MLNDKKIQINFKDRDSNTILNMRRQIVEEDESKNVDSRKGDLKILTELMNILSISLLF